MSITQTDHGAAASSAFEEAIFHALRRLGAEGRCLLLAVSGGADSTAMLCALARLGPRLGLRLEVATLDHGLRPESAAEAQRVLADAARLGVAGFCRQLLLEPEAPGVEERARQARYESLEALRAERGLDLVATAHTASDQAETVLMRLGRGAALAGAAAIRPRLGRVIRPLLELTRQQVEQYLGSLGQSFVSDPMNADPRFLRARIRGQLLPLFEVVAGPRVAARLARFAGYAAEDEALLDQAALAAAERITRGGLLDALALDALERPISRRVIARWLGGHHLPVDADLLDEVLEAVRQGRVATLPKDLLLVNRDGWLGPEPAPSRNFTSGAGVRAPDGL